MKIYIGPYKDRYIGPYQIASALCFWAKRVPDEFGIKREPDWVHDFGTWLAGGEEKSSWLMKVCEWIRDNDPWAKRKVEIRIDKYDTWSMDSTLAYLILPMLKQLKENKHGSPGDMPAFNQTSNSIQGCFDFYEEGDSEAWEEGHRQWGKILDEIIWAFEQIHPDYDWEEQYWITHPEFDLTKYPEDEGKLTIPVRWKVKGECDWEGRIKHQERIDAGLKLFGQYYQNLWD